MPSPPDNTPHELWTVHGLDQRPQRWPPLVLLVVTVIDGPQPSDQRHQPALDITIAVDVPLGCEQRPMTRQYLHIPQGTARSVGQPRRLGNEGPAPGMR